MMLLKRYLFFIIIIIIMFFFLKVFTAFYGIDLERLSCSIIDRLDGVRLLWSLLKSNNPKVGLVVPCSSVASWILT